MHTHGTESYARDGTEPYTETGVARTTDTSYNIIRVGDEIARIFEEMGLNVIHDRERAITPPITTPMSQRPGRDRGPFGSVSHHSDGAGRPPGRPGGHRRNGVTKPVLQIDGVKTAQVMLLVGTDDAGASFPDWGSIWPWPCRSAADELLWPGLAWPITLRTARFNQQLTKGSLLVEVGGHGNSLEEALAGARLFARSAAKVLLERVAQ